MKGDKVHDDDDGSREDAGGANTSYGAANDEGDGVGSSPADGRANFEDADGAEEDPFGVVKGIGSAGDELEGAAREHVGAGVPADVVEGVEFIGDCRDRGRDDGTVLLHDQPWTGRGAWRGGVTYQGNEEEG